MCLKEFFIVILFTVLATFIYTYFYKVVYAYKTYCVRKEWRNKNNIIYRFILGRLTNFFVYTFLSIILSLSIITNILTLKLFEIALLVLTILLTIQFSKFKIKTIFKNLSSELANYVNTILIYRLLIFVNSLIWLVVEFFFYNIDLKTTKDALISTKSECYLYLNLYKYSLYIDYIFWSIAIKLKDIVNLLMEFIIVLFILIKKISFVWGVIVATLGGLTAWKR
jgi:hypothetical protein